MIYVKGYESVVDYFKQVYQHWNEGTEEEHESLDKDS
jgi:hypothetical protein